MLVHLICFKIDWSNINLRILMLVMLRWNHIIVVLPTLQRDISEAPRVSIMTPAMTDVFVDDGFGASTERVKQRTPTSSVTFLLPVHLTVIQV
jgi:hypothetical protein